MRDHEQMERTFDEALAALAGEAEAEAPRRLGRRGVFGLLAGAALAGLAGLEEAAASRRKRRRGKKNRDRRKKDRKDRGDKGGKSKGQRIVREAKKHVGDNYVAGGTAPGGFDCSGFTYYVVKKSLGRDISPSLQAQLSVGKKVGKGSRRKGDLIFFTLEGGNQVTHVAIVLNKDRVIHAMNPSLGVKISDINSSYYMDNIHSVRRL
jgi:cell wall-associated NlpC family hydrolase